MISGGSLVRKDVPHYVKAAREPLSFVGINSIGMRRRGFPAKKYVKSKTSTVNFFQNKLNNTQALDTIEAEFPVSPERDEIIDFVSNSGRGIMKGYNQN